MIGIAAMALVAIAAYATQLGFHERMARFGLALILGGAFGNLIDRAVFGLRRRLRRRLLGRHPFLGVQRGGLGDYDRRDPGPARHDRARTATCIPSCLRSAGSRSTPTASCSRPRTCSGLQFALVRARTRGLDPNRVMDLGIWIIISALAGAKLLLLVVEFDTFSSNPAELLTLLRSGGVFYGGLIAAVVVALWYLRTPPDADVDGHRRLRAGHRARPRHRPDGLLLRRLLLRHGRPTCRGRSRSTTDARRRTSARR